MLPTELDTAVLSALAVVDHSEFGRLTGESSILDELESPFRGGIMMPLPLIVGEESGDDCSASVE